MSVITFAGNLAADPELRYTPSGQAVTRLTVIENRRRKSADGASWEDAEPNVYRVQVWGGAGENVFESCGKGDRVLITGRIVTDRWADKETGEARTGQHVTADEVGFCLRFHTVRGTKATRTAATAEADTEPPF